MKLYKIIYVVEWSTEWSHLSVFHIEAAYATKQEAEFCVQYQKTLHENRIYQITEVPYFE